MRWYAVVCANKCSGKCSGMWRYVVVCGGMWWYVVVLEHAVFRIVKALATEQLIYYRHCVRLGRVLQVHAADEECHLLLW
jgi:hypothetical protein